MRPIDAEHLKHEVNRIDGFAGCADVSEKALIGFNMMIDLEPTVDTTQAVHAHWIWRLFLQKTFYECSKCGKYNTSRTNYCGSCGAKMDNVDD